MYLPKRPELFLLVSAALTAGPWATACAPPPPPDEPFLDATTTGVDATTIGVDARPRPDAGPVVIGRDAAPAGVDASSDQQPPQVLALVPADLANAVPLDTAVSVTFDEALDCAAIGQTSVIVRANGANVGGSVSCQGSSVTFVPSAPLAAMTPHTVTVLDARDAAGNAVSAPVTWRFTTADAVDDTPPTPPTISPAPPPQTSAATLTVGGAREASSAIEGRWLLDGVERQPFAEVVALGAGVSWSFGFSLLDGVNRWELRARDGSGNLSSVVSFSVTKIPNVMMVPLPTVTFTPNTGVSRQVWVGTKAANTGIRVGAATVVPVSAATTWDHQVSLVAGANHFDVTAVDGSGNRSSIVPVDITYTVPPTINAGELKVELTIQDAWDMIGDEFRINETNNAINHSAVNIWVEGPLTVIDDNGTPSRADDTYEPCLFDAARFQRKYSRYVGSVSHSKPPMGPLWSWEPNYFIPNYFAALVEAGVFAAAPNPIPADVDRRDPSGRTWYPPSQGNCPLTWHRQPNGNCRPNVQTAPNIDGMSEASVNARVVNGLADSGAALGAWSSARTYRWNLRNRNGQPIVEGAYLLSVEVVLDRGARTTAAFAPALAGIDQETCWDNPAHDTQGQHRAEAIIVIDGRTARTVYLAEKGHDEAVDACAVTTMYRDCAGRCDWSAADTLASPPDCATPNSRSSDPNARVRYLAVPNGWPNPVRVEYCPTQACN